MSEKRDTSSTIAGFARLLGIPVGALQSLCDEHWGPGDEVRAALRLQIFAIPTVIPSGELRRDVYRREVAELVERGAAPSKARAIELIAIEHGVASDTVKQAVYRRRVNTPPSTPDDSATPPAR